MESPPRRSPAGFFHLAVFAFLYAAACGGEATRAPRADAAPAAAEPKVRVVERARVRAAVDRDYLPTVLNLIQGAEREIDVVHFLFDYGDGVREVERALADAAARGVTVRVLLDDWPRALRRSVPSLRRLGIDARTDGVDKRVHAKAIVADRRAATMNWGYGGLRLYHEVDAIVTEEEVVADLAAYYEGLWNAAESAAGFRKFIDTRRPRTYR